MILHTNDAFWHYTSQHYWKSCNFIECFFYFAVPVFFQCTGATLLDFSDRYGLFFYISKYYLIKDLKWKLELLAVKYLL